jgi:hypothetical protein
MFPIVLPYSSCSDDESVPHRRFTTFPSKASDGRGAAVRRRTGAMSCVRFYSPNMGICHVRGTVWSASESEDDDNEAQREEKTDVPTVANMCGPRQGLSSDSLSDTPTVQRSHDIVNGYSIRTPRKPTQFTPEEKQQPRYSLCTVPDETHSCSVWQTRRSQR